MSEPTVWRRVYGVLVIGACAAAPARAQPEATMRARVDQVLTALQKRSDGLTDIRCEVRFAEDDRINLSKLTKTGKIVFLITEPNPHFLIHFEKTQSADGVVGKQEWYLFDGRWLYQGLERLEQVTKQEVARPGEKLDLFDIEKTPFPVPFGQKKEKILKNFDVSIVPPAAGDPPTPDHLVCTPQPDSRLHQRYDKLELFVDRGVNLPTRIVVTKNNGLETNTADFPGLSEKSINTDVTAAQLEKPAAWKKYKEVVEELLPTD